ncbi:42705_t:CDS:10, partial [Gigaspora margarita]
HDIERFVTGTVWEKPLKKHIDVLDYDTFKNCQPESQNTCGILESRIERRRPDYNSMVLNRIKELDHITIGFKFLATSNLQYANQLELKEEREKSKNKRHYRCLYPKKIKPISTNIDDLPKIFDGTKSDFNWNYKCSFEPFDNFTNLAMFIWATKYMTSTAAYHDLVQILRHPKFDVNHLPTNLQSLKKQREQLPLMKIHTPSTNIKNPSLSSQLYFGPGIFSKSREELWEGNLWAESPLFGQPNLSTAQELYLVEESNSFLIEPSSLICHLSIWLQDQPAPSIIDFFVNQILYNYNGRWKLRSIKLRHQHPAECIPIKLPPNSNMPVFKFYLDLYIDDFGTFRNTYHSLGGVYLQIGNMLRQLRKQLRNHFIIGLVPFGGNLKDFIKFFINEIHQLEQGFTMNINGVDCWISGGIAMVTADLPQGNDIAGVLHHNANMGCRSCKASKDKLTDMSFDIYSNSRFHQITTLEFQNINEQSTNLAQSQLCSQYGLWLLPGENNFIKYWKHFEVPAKWSRLPNPISHRHSFMISDILRILMIFPFILRRFLKTNDVKTNFLEETKTSKKAFSLAINRTDGYIQLQKALNKELRILINLFPDNFQNLPNLHINRHIVDHACQYSTCVNTAVGMKEMVHQIFKSIVPHTNKHDLELTLLQQINTLQTLRYLVDGGIDVQNNNMIIQSIFKDLFIEPRLRHLLSGWCIDVSNFSIHTAQDYDQDLRTNGFLENIMRAYSLYFSLEQALLNTKISSHQNVSYIIAESNGDYQHVKFGVSEIVEATLPNKQQSDFGVIKGIIKHIWNNNQIYVFIYLNWLEDLKKYDDLLECPVYRLQHTYNNTRERIHLISIVSQSPDVPFIHNCKARCSLQQHDTSNHEYLRNFIQSFLESNTVIVANHPVERFEDQEINNYMLRQILDAEGGKLGHRRLGGSSIEEIA